MHTQVNTVIYLKLNEDVGVLFCNVNVAEAFSQENTIQRSWFIASVEGLDKDILANLIDCSQHIPIGQCYIGSRLPVYGMLVVTPS